MAIQEESKMNFLVTLESQLNKSALMDQIELDVAPIFVDKLLCSESSSPKKAKRGNDESAPIYSGGGAKCMHG